MGIVAKEVKAMSQDDILAFERAGEVTIATHCLKQEDIKVNAYPFAALCVCTSKHISLCCWQGSINLPAK